MNLIPWRRRRERLHDHADGPLLDLDYYWRSVDWKTELARYRVKPDKPREKS